MTLQTVTEDLLKMPSQYVDQVMYSFQLQQEQEQRQATFADSKEKRREHSAEHQQRDHSTLTTSATRSGTPNSNRSSHFDFFSHRLLNKLCQSLFESVLIGYDDRHLNSSNDRKNGFLRFWV